MNKAQFILAVCPDSNYLQSFCQTFSVLNLNRPYIADVGEQTL